MNKQKASSRSKVIHVLKRGRALCEFSRDPPEGWSEKHLWVRMINSHVANCNECMKRLLHEGKLPVPVQEKFEKRLKK